LLAVVATLWIGALLLGGGGGGGGSGSVDAGGGGGGGGGAIGSADAGAPAGGRGAAPPTRASRGTRPAGPPPAHLLFLGASAVARAERAKRSARAAAAEGGRPPGGWGGGPFRGTVWAAAATAGGAADADAGGSSSTAPARPWAAVEMVAVGPHVVRVVRPGAAVWAGAAGDGGASAPAGPVTVVVADGDDVGGLTSALRLLTLGGGCGVIGEVLVHATPAGADGPPTAGGGGDADGWADALAALLRLRLFRVAGGGACRHPGVVAAIDPPPPPPVLPPSAPVGSLPPPAAAASGGWRSFPPLLPVVHYAILSGAATFASRIPAVAASWLPGVPPGAVIVHTDAIPPVAALDTLPVGVAVTVTAPAEPDREPNLPRMSAWSHLTRLRDAWDYTLAAAPAVTHLALVDDDTFVFPGALPAALARHAALANASALAWGGALELARVDNGDGGVFAAAFRSAHVAAGGEPCTLPDEAVAAATRTSADVAAAAVAAASVGGGGGAAPPRAAPKACADTFCRRGCPPVPQGAAIVLTRALVAALRPAAASCEAATAPLCARCGSQRLYMCVHRVAALPRAAGPVTTAAVPGVRRDTWRREPIGGATRAVTFHAFERLRRLSVTGSMGGDMRQLADLAARHPGGVTLQDVADAIGCPQGGRWSKRVGSGKATSEVCVRRT